MTSISTCNQFVGIVDEVNVGAINAEDIDNKNHELSSSLSVRVYPTLFYVSKSGRLTKYKHDETQEKIDKIYQEILVVLLLLLQPISIVLQEIILILNLNHLQIIN